MIKLLNGLFRILKFILLFVSFGLTLYIIIGMYSRLQKSMTSSIDIFIPYLLILVCFFINWFLKQEKVSNNIFYNITCTLVFSSIIVVSLRAIFDTNMVLNEIMGYNVNFSYFSDFLVFMKIMLYGLIISNVVFMIYNKVENLDSTKSIEVL